MSRHTTRRKARIDQLADELTVGAALRLRCNSDDIHDVVRAVVDYLIEEYPAQELYIPASVTYPVAEIRSELAAGSSVRSICRKFRISRETLYRLLDDTPQSESSAA